jgi:lysophospholipase L1-like esterase
VDQGKRIVAVIRGLCVLGVCWAGNVGAEDPVPAVPGQKRDGLGNVFAKLEAGKPVKIAYLGGSITAAAGWRVQSREWFARRFPQARVEEIHAAIGGTGSDLGVYRLEQDALRHEPDLLFVEFSVNDGGAAAEDIRRAMEGIVRQTWARRPECDLCFVYTFRVGYEKELRQGLCPPAASVHERVAEAYGIPSVNFALRVVERETAGTLVFQAEKDAAVPEGRTVFSHDGVHPLDAGHAIYAGMLAEVLEGWIPGAAPVDHGAKLARTLGPDSWEAAKIVPVTEAMLRGSWTRLSREEGLGQRFGNRMDAIWEGREPGDRLSFRFRGRAAALYDLLGPDGGQVTVTVDGKPLPKPVARFDSYCTYHRIATLRLARDLDPDGIHEVTVEIHPEQPDRQPVAFRLKDPETELRGPKYQGTNVRVGGILLLGELVP